jgi:nucleotide-binding universal stress UspA family protein
MTLNFVSHCLTIIAFSIWAMAAAGPLHPQAAGDQKQNQQDTSGKIVSAKTTLLADEEVVEARRLLDQLGYWINSEVTGSEEARKDASLRHALTAFQKVESRPRTGVLTQLELIALRAARKPRPLEPGFPHKEEIPGFAAQPRIDLSVLGSRRRSLSTALLGSTAEAISRTAPCPVLVVHPQEREFR